MHAVHSFDEDGFGRLSSGHFRLRVRNTRCSIMPAFQAGAGAGGSGSEARGTTNTVVTVAGDGQSVITFRDEELIPGHSQCYVDVVAQADDISKRAGGQSAGLVRPEPIAKQVGISRPITNAHTSPTAVTRIVVGNSEARFDTTASPTDNLTPWLAAWILRLGVASARQG